MESQKSGRGSNMSAVIFFGAAFVLTIFGLFIFMKSDDTAFAKAQKQIAAANAENEIKTREIKEAILQVHTGLQDFKKECVGRLDEIQSAHDVLTNRVGAIDLEVQRVREKTKAMEVRAVPTTHTVKIEVQKPIPIEVIEPTRIKVRRQPVDLLERSGVKKTTKQKRH